MDLRQKLEQKRPLAPELRQSLKILTLSIPDLKKLVENEMLDNPVLEEKPAQKSSLKAKRSNNEGTWDLTHQVGKLTNKPSLQDILIRQLGMFAEDDSAIKIGEEIIWNLDENGYLEVSLDDISTTLNLPIKKVEKTLELIQKFDPPGVAARSISECLLIQLSINNESDPLLARIISQHLEDVAKKRYQHIAKTLGVPFEDIEPLIQKIRHLNPKPGRNYSTEEIQHIIPDIVISENEQGLEITIRNEDIPAVQINQEYRDMLKKNGLDQQSKEFINQRLNNAMELLRAISRRQVTLRKVTESLVDYQQEALTSDLSKLKPLTFAELAKRVGLHETTICRVVMNKYVQAPFGVVSLKSFFPNRLNGQNGESVSDSQVKRLIKECIDQEDKKRPLSDLKIMQILSENNGLKIARRTVTKYREELKILSSPFRRLR